MTAVVSSEEHDGKTRVTARALHKSVSDREKHEQMGFHQGWGESIERLAVCVARSYRGEPCSRRSSKVFAIAMKIFVNLAVKHLDKSIEFFNKLGFTFNPQFTDETAACMVISDDIYPMLLTERKFKEFTMKAIADATKTTEVLTCLSVESKDGVNRIVDGALKAGTTQAREPMGYGFMYGRSFNDLDGHIWEIIWMDPSHIQR